jgi:multidrug resistance efflux pump
MLALALNHVVHMNQTLPSPAPLVVPERAPFERSVSGLGTVEARTENIEVGSAVPGVVQEVYVSVGQAAKKGQPLFRVDDRVLRAKLQSCEKDLAVAESQLSKLEQLPRIEELTVSEAKLRVARANFELQEDLYQRGRQLHGRQAISTEEFRQRQLNDETARRQVAQAQADYDLLKAGAWEPDKAIARRQIARARAEIANVQTDLDRTVVRAPVDGDVLQVNVRTGEYIHTPAARPPIVLGDIRVLHVRVEIDEQEIPRFRSGASAKAYLRSEPAEGFSMNFVRVEPFVVPKKSLTADGAERIDTRVLQVIYSLSPGSRKLYVGQQLDVFLAAEGEGTSGGERKVGGTLAVPVVQVERQQVILGLAAANY